MIEHEDKQTGELVGVVMNEQVGDNVDEAVVEVVGEVTIDGWVLKKQLNMAHHWRLTYYQI